jgi:oligopeptide transport system substrate-binding protein
LFCSNFPTLSFLLSDTAASRNIAEFISKQLKDNLGINLKLEFVDSKTRSSRYSNSQFELFYGGWHEDYHDPENWLPELWGTGGGNNQFKYSNPKFDDLMKQAKFEQNNEKRISLYRDGHKVLMDDAAIAAVESLIRNAVVKPKVKNLAANPQDAGFAGQFNIEKVEIAKE